MPRNVGTSPSSEDSLASVLFSTVGVEIPLLAVLGTAPVFAVTLVELGNSDFGIKKNWCDVLHATQYLWGVVYFVRFVTLCWFRPVFLGYPWR